MTERKCPSCGSLAATIGTSTGTLMYREQYYNANGEYISNDPNIYTTEYTCTSCGQKYKETRSGKVIDIEAIEAIDTPPFTNADINGTLDIASITPSRGGEYLSNGMEFINISNYKMHIELSNIIDMYIINFNNVDYTINGAKLFELLEKYNILEKET